MLAVFIFEPLTQTYPSLKIILALLPFFIVATIIVIIFLLIFSYEAKRFNQTEFLFFEDELAWTTKGITAQQGSVLYKDIITLEVTTDIIQPWYGVSDVRLSFRSGDSSSGNPFGFLTEVQRGSHIHLFNLPNAQEAFQEIKKLVNDHKKELR